MKDIHVIIIKNKLNKEDKIMTTFKTNLIDSKETVFPAHSKIGAIEKKLRDNIKDRDAISDLQDIVSDINSYLRLTPRNPIYKRIASVAKDRYNNADRSGVEDIKMMAFILTMNEYIPICMLYNGIEEFMPDSIEGLAIWNDISTRTREVWFRPGYQIVEEELKRIWEPGFTLFTKSRVMYEPTSTPKMICVENNTTTKPTNNSDNISDTKKNSTENILSELITSGKLETVLQALAQYMNKPEGNIVDVEPSEIKEVEPVEETIDPDNTIVSDTFVMNVSEENTSGDEVLEPVQESKEVKDDELENRQREYLDPYFNNNEACAANFPSIRRLTRLIHDLDMHVDYFPLDGIDMHRVFGAKLIKDNQVLRNILIDPNGIYRNGINVIDTTNHSDDIYNACYIPLNDKEHLTRYLLGNFTDDDRAEVESDIPENIANIIERVDLSNLPKLKYKNWKYFIMNLSSMIRRAPKDAFFKLSRFDSTKDFMIEACGPEFNIYLNREIDAEAVKKHISNKLIGEYSPDKHGKKRFTFQNLSSSVKTA